MTNYKSLQHTKWECKYHIVFIPKYRRKAIYGTLRRELGGVFRQLALQKESEIEEFGVEGEIAFGRAGGPLPWTWSEP